LTGATVVVCAHNEENYITECLRSIVGQSWPPELTIVVADRCIDRTVTIARQELKGTPSIILVKDRASWRNSISENLQLALGRATGDALAVIDADITIPRRFLETLMPQLQKYAVSSPIVRTDPSPSLLNRLVAMWELTYAFAPLGEQPRGGARVISIGALRAVGGFKDVYAWESDLDSRLRRAGFKVRLDRTVYALHRRKMTLARSVAYQMQAGRARKELGVSSVRTLMHSVVRLRPFVMAGYLSA
jgi:glycosyltransferase involved in cell wall biosynthesis